MEYVYGVMLLHKAGKKPDEASLTKVLEATGITPDPAKVKAVIAAVEGVDIDQVIKESAVAPVAASQTAHPGDKTQEDKKEKKDEGKKKEEDKGSEEAAAAGLGALFG